MTLAICALSHSPLSGINDPDPETQQCVEGALETMRASFATLMRSSS